MGNGTPVPTATVILQTIRFFPVSIAMSTTVQIWMTSIRARMVMNIPVWHALTVTLQEVTNNMLV